MILRGMTLGLCLIATYIGYNEHGKLLIVQPFETTKTPLKIFVDAYISFQ